MPRRKSDRFRCPFCGRVLVKSPLASLLGEAGGFIAFGTGRVICPYCRGSIDARRMIEGEYDVPEASGAATLAFLGGWVAGAVLLHTKAGWGVGASILAAFGGALVLALLMDVFRRLRT